MKAFKKYYEAEPILATMYTLGIMMHVIAIVLFLIRRVRDAH